MDESLIAGLLSAQDGVLSRRQVLARGGDDNDIERKLRRREWSTIHPGVYVNHTGLPTGGQLAWAAVLYHWPAALAGRSALDAHRLRGPRQLRSADAEVCVAIDATRSVGRRRGVRVRRLAGLADRALMHLSPPRLRLEDALLDLASGAGDESGAVAVLADACQEGRTTPRRLLGALKRHPKLRRRRLIHEILGDVSSGAYSVLERRYLTRVERPHGLPTAKRQRKAVMGKGPGYRDVEYLGLRTIVELDGRLGHEWTSERWDDLDRDIASAVGDRLTLRIGWRQVLEPCRLAASVWRILLARGSRLSPHGCSPTCPVARISVENPAPGAGRSTTIS
ncbi:MAG: hypothetical protein L0H93_10415 [Nocardioides sp.]|nr:hypothetical protein [Nocardioides sp.]